MAAFPRPANYALVRIKPGRWPSGDRSGSARSWSSIRAPGTVRASAGSRSTARWHRAPGGASLLLRDVLSAAGAGSDDRVSLRGGGRVPAQGERAPPRFSGAPFPHRQLPGGLGAGDARLAHPAGDGPHPARRFPDLLLGRRRRQKPHALSRGAPRGAGPPRSSPTSVTASSTAPTWSPTSTASTRRTPTGASSTTSTPRSIRSVSASCSSRSGGAAASS